MIWVVYGGVLGFVATALFFARRWQREADRAYREAQRKMREEFSEQQFDRNKDWVEKLQYYGAMDPAVRDRRVGESPWAYANYLHRQLLPETYALNVEEKWCRVWTTSRITEWTTIDDGGVVHRAGQIQPSSMGGVSTLHGFIYVHLCDRLTRAMGRVEEHEREARPQITCLHCILIPED